MTIGGFSRARLERMHEVMAGHVESGAVPGLVTLLSRRGEVHVDAIGAKAIGGSDPMRRDTIFRIASMTKPVTAVAAMILVEECRLRLDDPVDRLLPELADRKVLRAIDSPLDDTVAANRPITLRDLLTMRMGFGIDHATVGGAADPKGHRGGRDRARAEPASARARRSDQVLRRSAADASAGREMAVSQQLRRPGGADRARRRHGVRGISWRSGSSGRSV